MRVELNRVYDAAKEAGGYRVLVDRVWPRGISKDKLRLDEWCREIAPSTKLRQWFGHIPDRWEQFRLKYREELKAKDDDLKRLRALARKQPLILLYSAKDKQHNQAVVLRDVLLEG